MQYVCLLTFLVALLLLGCAPPTSALRDANGPARIVSLAPSVTETLFALGVGDAVVGVSEYDDYPPQVAHLPRVGSFITPNIEEIAALRPTLVVGLSTASDVREIRALHAMGLATLMVDDGSVNAIEQSVLAVGDRIGRKALAESIVQRLRDQITSVQRRLRKQPRLRVLMVVGHQPLVAVGSGTFLDQLLRLADAGNIAENSGQNWPRLSIEYIIASRPAVILDGQMGTDPATPDTFWSKYPTIPAVRNHRVMGYPDDPTLHPGPRIGATLQLLARMIHPTAFSANAAVPQS